MRTADDLRAVSPRAAELVDQYLSSFGWRPLAADIEAPTLAEHPDRLVDLVRSQTPTADAATPVDPFDDLRPRVPSAERAEFDELVDEARECYASLDDNSGIVGLDVRRGAPGRPRGRSTRPPSGGSTRPDDAFNPPPTELLALAAGGSPVDRSRARRTPRATDIWPPWNPRRRSAACPSRRLIRRSSPGALAELAAAVGGVPRPEVLRSSRRSSPRKTGTLTVDGSRHSSGASPVVAGTVAGRIVVSSDPADALERIEPGDILVCPYTIAAHNSIFPMLGGVVTQFGGPLGHTAVMAREFDIPAVVGAGSLPLHLDGRHGELFAEL